MAKIPIIAITIIGKPLCEEWRCEGLGGLIAWDVDWDTWMLILMRSIDIELMLSNFVFWDLENTWRCQGGVENV